MVQIYTLPNAVYSFTVSDEIHSTKWMAWWHIDTYSVGLAIVQVRELLHNSLGQVVHTDYFYYHVNPYSTRTADYYSHSHRSEKCRYKSRDQCVRRQQSTFRLSCMATWYMPSISAISQLRPFLRNSCLTLAFYFKPRNDIASNTCCVTQCEGTTTGHVCILWPSVFFGQPFVKRFALWY